MPNPQEPIPGTVIKWGPLTVRLVELTPELAKEFKEANTHNRNLRQRWVDAYAADMSSEVWPFNGDAIRRAIDGTILDGQHRIESVLQSGETIVVLLVEGLEPETQETMDVGPNRKMADVLKLRGESHPDTLAGILWRTTVWELGGGMAHGSNVRPTVNQKLVTLEAYPWLREIAAPAKRVSSAVRVVPSILGLCWWLFRQIEPDDAQFFFERLGDGQGLMEGDAIYELRNTFRVASTEKMSNERWVTAILIKAWNAYRDGRQVGKYKFQAGGAKPESFPNAH